MFITISAQKWFTPEAEKQVDALLSQVVEGNYKNNRYPLLRKPLMELPLGSIKPKGWLHEMLVRQKNGASGQMDESQSATLDRMGFAEPA